MTTITPRKIKRYGWRRDLPDFRDHCFRVTERATNLPPSVDLRPGFATIPPYDQGELGSCTANAIAAAVQYDRVKQNLSPNFAPSRLFIYYNERVIEGSVNEDSGAQIRDGIKSIQKQGVPPETDWPYNVAKFTQKPPAKAYQDGLQHKGIAYSRVAVDVSTMKAVLAGGYPIVVGFTVYQSFESDQVAQTGEVPMPTEDEEVLGGHAVLVVGYDNSQNRFIVRNSWGTGWGMQGYFTMPYEYLGSSNYANDFWKIQTISG